MTKQRFVDLYDCTRPSKNNWCLQKFGSANFTKPLVYVNSGKVECRFFQLKDASDDTAPGLKSLLLESFAYFGIDLAQKLVSICVNGAAVNLGVHNGLSALFKQELPWLVAIHCMNHRLELAAKDAFSSSYFNEFMSMLCQPTLCISTQS